ncbi:MAG: FecR domain-containing protein [Lewinellaceae bacterium]|nr:FecR domain-containing protein [Lewinellaceae bacterium]
MHSNDNYILLLSKKHSGEISPDEQAALDEWLAQSPEHSLLAAQMKAVWEQAGSYQKEFSPDLDAAFRQVQDRIRAEERPPLRVVSLGSRLLRIAAALALILASVWSYREFSAPDMMRAVAGAETRMLSLPDGTDIWLRQNAEIAYPTHFDGNERHVSLQGEAYFEVAHNPARPFIVDLPNGDRVKVLGTKFGIRLDPALNQTMVFVRSGKVHFSPKLQPNGVILTERQKAVYDRNSTQLTVDKYASLNELAWQTGGLEFVRTPMEEVVSDLERFYKVDITLRNTAMRACLHTAPLTNQPIEKVLESLALTYQFRVEHPAPGQYVLSGGDCQ